MPSKSYHDTFFKEGFLMFLNNFVEVVFKVNKPSHNIKVINVVRRESSQPGSGTADLCLEVLINLLKGDKEQKVSFLLIVEHKSFYDEKAIFTQVKYHNGLYQEQISLGQEVLPVLSLFCCHGKGSNKTPTSTKEVLLRRGLSKSCVELFDQFILFLEWLRLDFNDKKVLSLFKEHECSYIAYVLHEGLDFKLTEDNLIEVIKQVNKIKNPNKRVKAMESVFTYIDGVFPNQMTETLLQCVDLRAKKENLLKEGENIMTYSSMRELVMAEGLAKGMLKGREKGKTEGLEQGKEDVALRMLEQNMDLSLIAQLTGLSISKLQQLKK